MKWLFKGPVLITGGSSQLGMALARALREEGAETLSVCRSSEGLARCGGSGALQPSARRTGKPAGTVPGAVRRTARPSGRPDAFAF